MSPAAFDFEKTVVKRKSVKIIQRVQKAVTSVSGSRHEIGAPVTGITLCTHVGQHSGTHFDNGIAVNLERNEGNAR